MKSDSAPHPPASTPGNGPTELRTHLRSIRRFYRSVGVITLLAVAVAVIITMRTPETYQSRVAFFASSSAEGTSTALAADEFAQRRINSYVGVVQSQRMADVIIKDTGLDMTANELSATIHATTDPETVLLNVTVTDTLPERSLEIAESISKNLDSTVAALDNRGSSTDGTVALHVISGPTLNPDPVAPLKKLNLGIGLLLGLGLGIAQAITRQQLDTTLRSGKQLADATGRPTLAELKRNRHRSQTSILTADTLHSRYAESYRQLRTNLRFVDAARPVQVIVVTSSVANEGKTTVAANLAMTFAESGRRVLLIDGDLRRPRLESYLDLEGSVGLTDILIGESSMSDVLQTWGPQGLQVLASGLIPPNPAELLGGSTMEKLIEEARTEFEIIILDTPPLLPVTDAAVTANLADGVIVVVRHGHTTVDQVQYSLSALDAVDARILGTVLSMAPSTRRDDQPLYYRASDTPIQAPGGEAADTDHHDGGATITGDSDGRDDLDLDLKAEAEAEAEAEDKDKAEDKPADVDEEREDQEGDDLPEPDDQAPHQPPTPPPAAAAAQVTRPNARTSTRKRSAKKAATAARTARPEPEGTGSAGAKEDRDSHGDETPDAPR